MQRRVLLLLGAFALTMTLPACGSRSTLPTTWHVTGMVLTHGGLVVAGGAVQFASLTDSSFTASGDIRPDGTFELASVQGVTRVRGAPEGEYRVTVIPPLSVARRAARPIVLAQPVRVEPKKNHLTLSVAAPRTP